MLLLPISTTLKYHKLYLLIKLVIVVYFMIIINYHKSLTPVKSLGYMGIITYFNYSFTRYDYNNKK